MAKNQAAPAPDASNEYLMTIRIATQRALDPEQMRMLERKVADLLRNTVWESTGILRIEGSLWGRNREGQL
jgi:hypothetical protein